MHNTSSYKLELVWWSCEMTYCGMTPLYWLWVNPAKVNLTQRTHQTISFSSPRDKNMATESFQMIICMLGGIFFPSSFRFFSFFLFFFFACSIHDVSERNYKLLPKFIHSLLLILPVLFLLLLWLLFYLPFPPFFPCLCLLLFHFFLFFISLISIFLFCFSYLLFSVLFPPIFNILFSFLYPHFFLSSLSFSPFSSLSPFSFFFLHLKVWHCVCVCNWFILLIPSGTSSNNDL